MSLDSDVLIRQHTSKLHQKVGILEKKWTKSEILFSMVALYELLEDAENRRV